MLTIADFRTGERCRSDRSTFQRTTNTSEPVKPVAPMDGTNCTTFSSKCIVVVLVEWDAYQVAL